jgi:hypothetical protein
MSKIILREEAIKLRSKGFTYGQIRRKLGVAKSTLSGWLKNFPLSETQQEKLSQNKKHSRDVAREKYIITRKNQRLNKLKNIYNEQVERLLPLSEKELFLAGAFLYWGEGAKRHGIISISNTDPRVIKFALYWMVKVLKIPKDKIRVGLHLYKDMNVKQSIDYWSKTLSIPTGQFNRPYIKKTNRQGLTYKSFGHGTCLLYHGSVVLSEKVAMSVKALSDFYGAKDEVFWYN